MRVLQTAVVFFLDNLRTHKGIHYFRYCLQALQVFKLLEYLNFIA